MLLEIGDRVRIRLDPPAGVQGREVGLQIQTGGSVETVHLVDRDRRGQPGTVVDPHVPRGVSARPSLDLSTHGEEHQDADLVVPAELLLLLPGEVVGVRFGQGGVVPAGDVADGR